jgi:NADP-dependent aldehyde dehydrogenase
MAERADAIADEFSGSCLLGGGQFCTNPGFVVVFAGAHTGPFIARVREKFDAAPSAVLLSSGVAQSLKQSVGKLRAAGAKLITSEEPAPLGCRYRNTLLQVTGKEFLAAPGALQAEAFGASALLVVVNDADQADQVLNQLEGNLTGCVYSDTAGADDALYERLAPVLQRRVGRLLNDKMPTGVTVSPAMVHGGPYPATGHPGFTAVGIPAALRRFAALQCFDNVRSSRLPDSLRDKNPNGRMWRTIDGAWTQADVK